MNVVPGTQDVEMMNLLGPQPPAGGPDFMLAQALRARAVPAYTCSPGSAAIRRKASSGRRRSWRVGADRSKLRPPEAPRRQHRLPARRPLHRRELALAATLARGADGRRAARGAAQ